MTAHTAPAGNAEPHTGPHHVNPRPILPEGPAALTKDVAERFAHPRLGALLVISGLLFLGGIVGVVMRVQGGYEDRAAWGFYAAVFAWVLSTGCSAPILSVATRFTKGYWRKPLVRMAELFTVTTILLVLLFIPLLPAIPSVASHVSFWMTPASKPLEGGPQWALLFGVLGLMICGLGLLYTSARADKAMMADQNGQRTALTGGASPIGGWGGTPHQWKVMRQGITYLGAFYLMFLVLMHFLVSVELAITLVPGWRDPIFPAFHAITGLQAGLATLIIMLAIMKRLGGYDQYLALDQFWNPAKLLMAFTMLWFYFWWSAFIIFWYGRTPAEVGVLLATEFGPYLTPFVIGFVLNFVAPLLLLVWNPIRVSFNGPVVAAVLIVIGNFFDRWRIYGGAFGINPLGGHELPLERIPMTRIPDLADLLVLLGAIGGMVFFYLIAARLVPPVSLWELKEGQLLTRVQKLLRTTVTVIGKPE